MDHIDATLLVLNGEVDIRLFVETAGADQGSIHPCVAAPGQQLRQALPDAVEQPGPLAFPLFQLALLHVRQSDHRTILTSDSRRGKTGDLETAGAACGTPPLLLRKHPPLRIAHSMVGSVLPVRLTGGSGAFTLTHHPMQFLISLVQFVAVFALVLLVFNLIIIVHEWGHFLAARWRGLQVDKFQIWFGKPLWKKTINGVQYGLGSIPAGGFVALPQMAPMELLEGKRNATTGEPLTPIKPLDKVIVAFAGPLFSFLLAVVLAVVVWIVGYPASKSGNSTTIGGIQHGSGAYEAGLQPGDEVLRVDGKPVSTFTGMVDSITWAVISSRNDNIEFVVRRNGQELSLMVHAPVPKPDSGSPWWRRLFERPDVRRAGIMPKQTPVLVGEVKPNSPAEAAGLRKGDIVTEINGKPLFNYFQISEHIAATKDAPIQLAVTRDGQPLEPVTIHPRVPENPGSLSPSELRPTTGFRPLLEKHRPERDRDTVSQHVPPLVQIESTVRTMFNTLGAVFSPKSGISASHLSGPVGIMHLYYRLFMNPDGWKLVLWFSVLLNVNLAILNLLPFPILDGGHITMAIFEGVFRRPISLRVLEVVNAGCAIFLLGFMLYLSGFDAGEIFRSHEDNNFRDYSFEPLPRTAPATP